MKVRHAAKEALLAMGYPYAMELPPDLLDTKREDGREPGLSAGNVVLAVVSALYQSSALVGVGPPQVLPDAGGGRGVVRHRRGPLALHPAVPGGPPLAFEGHAGRRFDDAVGGGGGVDLIALPAAVFTSGMALIFAPWHLALWTAIALRPEDEQEEQPTPRPPRPRPTS